MVLGGVLAVISTTARVEAAVGGHLAATTDYVLRGLSQTRGAPALQADLHVEHPSGWFVGAWGSTIDLNRGPGATLELNAYAGLDWQLDPAWSARLTAVHYAYPNDTDFLRYDYDEVIGSLAFRDRLVASVAWSPNTARYSAYYGMSEEGTALTYDLVGNWPLTGSLTATAGVGYYDLDDLFGTGYGYWNAGLVWTRSHLQLELGWYATTHEAEELFSPETTGQRWSLTATWQFQLQD
jgi:uncharacterized protein (TIGR02001 family)